MAVSSVSSTSSLYGTRNVISGLASGMDTESMIQNAVSGYKSKITSLQQKRTKLEWQQEAYRSMIAKAANLSSKYTSYTSSTNLASKSFFTSAVNMVTNGANKDKIAATGKTNSSVQIDRVQQLATAARYSTSGATLGDGSANASTSFNLDETTEVSNISGGLQLAYGGAESPSYAYVDIDSSLYKTADELARAINTQLQGNDTIGARVNGDSIEFYNKKNEQEAIRITDVYGDTKNMVTAGTNGTNSSGWVSSFEFKAADAVKEISTAEHLEDATMSITLDGQTKTIKGPTMEEVEARANDKGGLTEENKASAYVELLQERIDQAFGTMKDASGNTVSKLKVENALDDPMVTYKKPGDIQLKFSAPEENHSVIKVTSNKTGTYGFGTSGISNNLNTNTTLSQVADKLGLTAMSEKTEDGKTQYQFSVNGVKFEFTEDTTLDELISKVNSSEAGVKVTYSQTTNKFAFEATETGSAGRIEFDENMKALFSSVDENGNKVTIDDALQEGQDAIFQATINGDQVTLTRSSNIVDLDGLQVTLKGTFGYQTNEDGSIKMENGKAVEDPSAEAVTFTSNVNTEKILNAVKSFIEDYNALATEVKGAYSTLPLKKSSGAYYEPLTEDEEADLSESAIEKWNENAKTGLLFGDSDLASFYSELTSAVSLSGDDGAFLRSIGIEQAYSNGLSTLTLDEEKFKAALEADPDKVADLFTKSKENGASSDGLMASLAKPLDKYAKTIGSPKGILVEKAGSVLSPSNLYTNYMQQQLDALDDEISKWQDKMSDKVDYYTSKFSSLEQLIANMNSQSSALSQMMGG